MLPLQGDASLIPGQGNKIPHAKWCGKKKKKKFAFQIFLLLMHKTILFKLQISHRIPTYQIHKAGSALLEGNYVGLTVLRNSLTFIVLLISVTSWYR